MYTTTTQRVAGKVVAFTDHRPPYERGTSFVMVQDRRTGKWRLPTPAERAAMWNRKKAGEP